MVRGSFPAEPRRGVMMARTSTMLLLTGDYADRLDDLYNRAMQAAQDAARANQSGGSHLRLGERSEDSVLREEYEDLRKEAEREGVKVVLQSIGRREWRALKEKHPPRVGGDEETQKGDRLAGVNVDSIEDDLVYASLLEPKFETRAAYDEWADGLSEGDFQAILTRAWGLVNVPRVDPKSLAASPTRINGAS